LPTHADPLASFRRGFHAPSGPASDRPGKRRKLGFGLETQCGGCPLTIDGHRYRKRRTGEVLCPSCFDQLAPDAAALYGEVDEQLRAVAVLTIDATDMDNQAGTIYDLRSKWRQDSNLLDMVKNLVRQSVGVGILTEQSALDVIASVKESIRPRVGDAGVSRPLDFV
jgi:hypothetical protein